MIDCVRPVLCCVDAVGAGFFTLSARFECAAVGSKGSLLRMITVAGGSKGPLLRMSTVAGGSSICD